MNRPLSHHGIDELETLFREGRDSAARLRKLLEELKHRSTKRAVTLRVKVKERLASLEDTGFAEPIPHQLDLPFDEK